MRIALNEPKNFQAIMLSSTFTDLKEHRQKVIEAINKFDYRANVMEYSGPRADANVIQSSLKMVSEAAAYIGVISRKYGQNPFDAKLNPEKLSITELEFNEAMRLDRPILLFIMGEKHPLTEANIEFDPDKRKKLEAFRERAKRMKDGSEVERVYEVFESLQQFSEAAAIAVGHLIQHLKPDGGDVSGDATGTLERDGILPHPPALVALPRYLGSHSFVGRASELEKLTDWCSAADPNPMLLFEAMGGSGKSMLTWEWITRHSPAARADWAGRFWYSFYEKGAVMADFCRHALAYMTMKPAEEFVKLRMSALSDRLLDELDKRPWLVVLDGLERVLVAYHRHDAAQLRDDEVDAATDQIGKRDPCAAIRPEDDDLMRRLAAVTRSKILVSSRLTPLALVNRSGMPVPGVRREILPGLRPPDAEAMIRACGITGRSEAIQAYLQSNCDCHPLVTGALAGLINDYLLDRGNFDRWANDPHCGGALNLAELDLMQRRTHILLAAINALEPESRKLLQMLALLQGGADFNTLKILNSKLLGGDEKLGSTIRDLEKRGLLQYDHSEKRYDLHPVVRGVAAGGMGRDETQELGQKVVDFFTNQPHGPWETADTLDDVASGLQVVRVLLRMRRYDEALRNYQNKLSQALYINLEAQAEMQALLASFFPDGWNCDPVSFEGGDQSYLLNDAALALRDTYPDQARKLLERKLAWDLQENDALSLSVGLFNLTLIFWDDNKLADVARSRWLSLDLAETIGNDEAIFASKLSLFRISVACGDRKASDRLWRELDGMGRNWTRGSYRSGDAEEWRAADLFYSGRLTEEVLRQAETLAKAGRNRSVIYSLYNLRGKWHMTRDESAQAMESFAECVRMSHEDGFDDKESKALLVLAHLRVDENFDARSEAERLSVTDRGAFTVAELWHALGERDRAVEYAQRAHQWAVADGEPHVHRYYLDRARALLIELGVALPEVPRYDPSKEAPYPWEKEVRAFIEKLKAEKKEATVPSADSQSKGS
jgi:hypothetical protein